MEKENIHQGHRQRLKSKIKDFGVNALAEHEYLELLLTYVIPRRNTNDISHHLLDTFGNFRSILDAGYLDLMQVKGVGPEVALYLSSLKHCCELYAKDAGKVSNFIKKTEDAINFFRTNFEIREIEDFYIICMNSMNKVIKTLNFKGTSCQEINLSEKQITNSLASLDVKYIILCHTHPDGMPYPSKEDDETTNELFKICAAMGIIICDHIIFTSTNHFSYAVNNKLTEVCKDCVKAFPKHFLSNQTLKQLSRFYHFEFDEDEID